MPDTDCAKLLQGPAFQKNGCAMISDSTGHSARLLLLPREAGRCTPMTGTDRSQLSRGTLLFLFILLGMPIAAHCDTLEDSAKELARKIAATLPEGETLHCDMQNHSSLETDEVDRIGRALQSELGHPCSSGSVEKAAMVVTLSENLEYLVWTAVIQEGGESHTVLLSVPHPDSDPVRSNAPRMNLTRERFWEGVERPLDADTISLPNGNQLVLLFFGDALLVRNPTANSEIRVNLATEIPGSQLRESSGTIIQNERSVDVRLDRRACTISLDAYSLSNCHDFNPDEIHVDRLSFDGGQIVSPVTPCSGNQSWLVTGTGDDTQPDSLKIIEIRENLHGITVSNRLDFIGPIVAIHSGAKFHRVIIRNLSTGNYEAYRISISCGQ